MGLLRGLSRAPSSRVRMLVDISAHSVAGGYAAYPTPGLPMLCWGKRVPIVARPEEAPEVALERALNVVGEALVREGAPATARIAGTFRMSGIIVSVDAPWERTSVRIEHLQEDTPFTLTRRGVSELLRSSRPEEAKDPGRKLEEDIVDIRINGYQTSDPYGKRANRATFTVLTSSLDAHLAEQVAAMLRSHFHTTSAEYVSGPSLRYQVLRDVFPHERDVLIVDVLRQDGATVSLVRAGALVAVDEPGNLPTLPTQAGANVWTEAIKPTLEALATKYPLPRTMLVAAAGV